MQRYGIRPIVLVRDVLDALVSLHDHFERESTETPVASSTGSTDRCPSRSGSRFSSTCTFPGTSLPHVVAGGRGAPRGPLDELRGIFADQAAGVRRILDFYGLKVEEEEIRRGIEAAGRGRRFNVAGEWPWERDADAECQEAARRIAAAWARARSSWRRSACAPDVVYGCGRRVCAAGDPALESAPTLGGGGERQGVGRPGSDPGHRVAPVQDYDSAKPVVSVLLPTFRRGASGLFLKRRSPSSGRAWPSSSSSSWTTARATAPRPDRRAHETGSTGELPPAPAQRRPARGVRVRGLHEGTGRLPRLAFDDDEFHPDAIERLFGFAQARGHAIVHGHVEVQSWDDRRGEAIRYPLGRGGAAPTVLRVANAIANNSVLLHRRVVETVGFFRSARGDRPPLRLGPLEADSRSLQNRRGDIPVGIVGGPGTRDSLEHTYPSTCG